MNVKNLLLCSYELKKNCDNTIHFASETYHAFCETWFALIHFLYLLQSFEMRMKAAFYIQVLSNENFDQDSGYKVVPLISKVFWLAFVGCGTFTRERKTWITSGCVGGGVIFLFCQRYFKGKKSLCVVITITINMKLHMIQELNYFVSFLKHEQREGIYI